MTRNKNKIKKIKIEEDLYFFILHHDAEPRGIPFEEACIQTIYHWLGLDPKQHGYVKCDDFVTYPSVTLMLEITEALRHVLHDQYEGYTLQQVADYILYRQYNPADYFYPFAVLDMIPDDDEALL